MTRYIVRRLLQVALTAVLASIFLFLMMSVMRGDAVTTYFGESHDRNPAAEAVLKAQLGIDKPLPVQYLVWLGKVVRGDLGTSWRWQQPVSQIVWSRVQLSFEMWCIAIVISLVGSVSLGIYLAVHQNSFADQTIRVLGLIALSAPVYWVAIALLFVLSRVFHWIPPVRYVTLAQNPWQHLQIIAFPGIIWGALSIPPFSRYVRAAVLDVLSADYVRTARGKGVPERRILYVHALRNAAGPLATVVGISMAGAVGGNVLLENVFSLPGIGRLLLTAIGQRDYPVVMGVNLVISLVFLVVMLLTDLSYAWLDPRIRFD